VLGRVLAEPRDEVADLLRLLLARQGIREHQVLVYLAQREGLAEAGDVGLGLGLGHVLEM
jgi:hypothetical protein